MNALRSILLHLDASPRCAARLQLGRELAARHGATLTALYAVVPNVVQLSSVYGEAAAGMLPLLQQLDAQRRDQARALFEHSTAAASTAAAPVQWRELNTEPVIAGFSEHALCADLLLLGQHDPDEPSTSGVPPDLVASVLIDSGKPGLVVPYAGSFASLGQQVLIAWKPAREAARAVSAAMPLLQQAQVVHVACQADGGPSAAGPEQLEAYLRLHGVNAAIEHHSAVPTDTPGEALLSLAADVRADLLVMGCYGHSRLRELVLGGASRSILRSMTVPVLMAH